MTTATKPTTTRDGANVGFLPAVDACAEQLTALQLRPREITLKRKASKSDYVNQLRRDIRTGRARPWFMISAVSVADVDDPTVPLEEVLEPYRRAIELLTQRRREVETFGIDTPSLLPAIQRENMREDAENRAEDRVLVEQDNPLAYEELLARSAAEIEAQLQRDHQLRQRIVTLRARQTHISRSHEG